MTKPKPKLPKKPKYERLPKVYLCMTCGRRYTDKKKLAVKYVSFRTMGLGPQTLRARAVGHICFRCMLRDPDYNMENIAGKSAGIERRKEQG